jgi:hypothetical protein
MPSNITNPLATGSVDRLSLAITSPRGQAESATTGACGSGCALCVCFDAEASAVPWPPYCFEGE